MSEERVEILRRTYRDGRPLRVQSWQGTLGRLVRDPDGDVVALVMDGGFVHLGRDDWADRRTVTLTEWEYVR